MASLKHQQSARLELDFLVRILAGLLEAEGDFVADEEVDGLLVEEFPVDAL